MSLFVGNVSRNVSLRDLKKEFGRYGECQVDLRGSFAFVDFDKENEAEEAKTKLQGQNLGGLKINIEWSKKSGKFDKDSARRNDGGRRRNRSRSGSRDNRDRRNNRRRSGSRDNNRRNDRRGRSRSDSSPRRERGSPSYSPVKQVDDEKKN